MIWSVVASACAAPPAARSEATRIGITRSSAAARMPASAVPLVSLRLLPLGSSPGVGLRSRSTAS